MEYYAEEVIDGLKLAMRACGAIRGVVAIKKGYDAITHALNCHIREFDGIEIQHLDHFYPAGDEFVLVAEVTGKIIPEGNLPLSVGVLVQNVATLRNIHDAISGDSVTQKVVTLGGEVNHPQVVSVPIGTRYRDLIELAGGATLPVDEYVVIDGGPMMGTLVSDLDAGITKKTSGVLLLPIHNPVVAERLKPLLFQNLVAKSICNQCSRCTDFCPRYLLGHVLKPNKMMESTFWATSFLPESHKTVNQCCLCGLCTFFACEMGLSPMAKYNFLKKEVTRESLAPARGGGFEVHPFRREKQVATHRLIERLKLDKYDKPLPVVQKLALPNRVRIALNQHIGAPLTVIAQVGDQVEVGEVLASSAEHELGTPIHASISGMVTEVNGLYIDICA
jgi:Na+-translocating ferredoxin:NAD+ oxidoreductase RnfC subunit